MGRAVKRDGDGACGRDVQSREEKHIQDCHVVDGGIQARRLVGFFFEGVFGLLFTTKS